MSISSQMTWQVQNGGSDTNGGGFRGALTMTPGGVAVTAPQPVLTGGVGGSLASGTYYVVLTFAVGNPIGTALGSETPMGPYNQITVVASGSITVTAPTLPNMKNSTYNVYVGSANGGPYYLAASLNTANYVITALPATTVAQAPGVDYSQQNSAQVVITNTGIVCTTPAANSNTLTFVTGYTPSANDVGNVVNITGGTNINTGWYEIVGWSSTTWTLTGAANLTNGTGAGLAITGNMGGAFATPGMFGTVSSAGNNNLFVQYNSTPYTATATANGSGGRLSSNNGQQLSGYNTTRAHGNRDSLRPTVNAAANSITIFDIGTEFGGPIIENFIAGAGGFTGVTGFHNQNSYHPIFANCEATGVATGFNANNSGFVYIQCQATGCTTAGFNTSNGTVLYACETDGCTGYGFELDGTGPVAVKCVARGTIGTGFGFHIGGYGMLIECTSYDNNGNNFNVGTSGPIGLCINCLSYGSTGGADFGGNNGAGMPLFNCAGGGSSMALQGQGDTVLNYQSLTSNPFNNAAGLDFSLNITAGGGAACRAAGIPGFAAATQLPGLSTLAYTNIGAVQSQAGASGAAVPIQGRSYYFIG